MRSFTLRHDQTETVFGGENEEAPEDGRCRAPAKAQTVAAGRWSFSDSAGQTHSAGTNTQRSRGRSEQPGARSTRTSWKTAHVSGLVANMQHTLLVKRNGDMIPDRDATYKVLPSATRQRSVAPVHVQERDSAARKKPCRRWKNSASRQRRQKRGRRNALVGPTCGCPCILCRIGSGRQAGVGGAIVPVTDTGMISR